MFKNWSILKKLLLKLLYSLLPENGSIVISSMKNARLKYKLIKNRTQKCPKLTEFLSKNQFFSHFRTENFTSEKYVFAVLRCKNFSIYKFSNTKFSKFPQNLSFYLKKSDAQVGRVNTFHILQTIRKGPSNFI
jgi:hypothetical protein